MKSNVYTRTGDEGTTSLASGQRVAKTHVRLEAYGTIDELSSHLGLLISLLADEQDKARLRDIQNCLFDVSCELATIGKPPRRAITDDDVTHLEQAIDQLDALCGGWKGFILPGGTQAAAQAHVCRTVCRRAERRIWAIDDGEPVDATLRQYVNRLSDYLFLLAKEINFSAGVEENIWRKR